MTVPKSVKTIGEYAFFASTLKNITFLGESNLETIEKYAFGSTFIESIEIPKSVKTIGEGAFSNIYTLKLVEFKGDIPVIQKYAFENIGSFFSQTEGIVDKTTYPNWNGINYIDDLIINKLFKIKKKLFRLFAIIFYITIYTFIPFILYTLLSKNTFSNKMSSIPPLAA